MQTRTDLAIENTEKEAGLSGIVKEELKAGDMKITRIEITNPQTAEIIKKPVGKYITVECKPLTDNFRDLREEVEIISREINNFLPSEREVLVAGLGNTEITPDALGAKSMKYILATRHIKGEFARSAGLDNLRSVSVISTGVLGQTGIEVSESIKSLSESLKPSAVIVVDALAARELSRLGCTVQISNTGIYPGSGVGNHRKGITNENIGVPVIAVGVPTVVNAVTLAEDILNRHELEEKDVSPRGESMIVTPREIDLLIERAAKLVGMSINCALQREYDFDTLLSLVS